MAPPMRMQLYAWVILVVQLVSLVGSVDKSNFKTCDQSGFCKRHRKMEADHSPYAARMDTLSIESTKISLQLRNLKTHIPLLMQITGLKNNTMRVKISEMNPLRPRYEPKIGDCLVAEPVQDSLKVDSHDHTGASIIFGNNKLAIQAEPFRMDFLTDDKPVMSFNAKGLLKFEHYREKETAPPEEPEGEKEGEEGEDNPDEHKEEEQEKKDDEEPDLWEETFKTHTDTKPHGPSSVGFDVSFPGFEHVYGIPEHADDLALRSTKNTDPYRLYNLDVFEYDLNVPMALYKSVPYMLAHNEERTVGIFWQNAAEMWVDIANEKADKGTFSKLFDMVKGGEEVPEIDTHWFAESGFIDVFFMFGPEPKDVFKQYATLTGTTPLPPLFSIGYHQSRWNYNDEEDVASVDNNFDVHDIPMDVIWLDIEHTDGKRYFTWDASKFPNSKGMIDKVSAKGRKMVTIVDPHLKKDDNYIVYTEVKDKDYPVKDKNNNHYDGWCWPGSSVWPDFFNPEVREYWANKFSTTEYVGSTNDLFIWNDMNEPSVFNGPEITMHKDAKHYGDWEHRDVHNVYALLVHQATFNGLLKRDPNQRPFVLSRGGFAGTQRYGAVWTGDNTGEWGHLKISIPMILSLNLAGITFSGADIGGFFKNPDAELLTRWYQVAAYQPFFRAHAHLDTRRREPWLLPDENKKAIRAAIRARYSLLPYWYLLFHQSETSGEPIVRPLWVEFPKDTSIFKTEDAFMVGNALLVHPVTDAGASGVNVYLPGKDELWYDIDTRKQYQGGQTIYVPVDLEKIPVFQRGGTIIARKERIRRSSILGRHDPYTLVIAPDSEGSANGWVYEDDFTSHKYKEGAYIKRYFFYEHQQLMTRNKNKEGTFESKSWIEKILIMGYKQYARFAKLELRKGGERMWDHEYDEKTETVTIRRPGVNINIDFIVTARD